MLRNLGKLVCLLCIFTSVVEGRRDFKEKIKKCFGNFFPEKPTPPPPPVSCSCKDFSTLESLFNQDGVVIDRERSCKISSDADSGEVFGIFSDPDPGSGLEPLRYTVSFDRLTCQSNEAIESLSSKAEADVCKDILVKTCESLPPPPPPPPATCPCTEFSTLNGDVLQQAGVFIDPSISCRTFFDIDTGGDTEFGIFAESPPGSSPPRRLDYVVSFDRLTCQSVNQLQFLSSEAEADACKDLLVDACREFELFPPGSCPCNFSNELIEKLTRDGVGIDREQSCKVITNPTSGTEVLGIFEDLTRPRVPPGRRIVFNYVLSSDPGGGGGSCITEGDQQISGDLSPTQVAACQNDLFESCIELKIPIPPASCPCFSSNELVEFFSQEFIITDPERSCIFTDDPTGSVGVRGGNGFRDFSFTLSFGSRGGTCILEGDTALPIVLPEGEIDACKNELKESCVELKIPIKTAPPASCPCPFTNELVDFFNQDSIITDFENSCIFTDDPTGFVGVFGGNGIKDLSYSLSFGSRGGTCITQGDQVNPDVLSMQEVDACKNDLKESCATLGLPASCPCGFSKGLLRRLRQDDATIDLIKSCKFDNADPREEILGIFATDLNGDALNYDLGFDSKGCRIESDGVFPNFINLSDEQVGACTNDLLESCVELGIPTPPRPPTPCPCDFGDGLIDRVVRNNLEIITEGSCDFRAGSSVSINARNFEGRNLDNVLGSDSCLIDGGSIRSPLSTRKVDACRNDLLESCFKLNIPILDDTFGSFRSEL